MSAFSIFWLVFFEYASLVQQVIENIISSKYFLLHNCSIVENIPAVMSFLSCFNARYFLSGHKHFN